MDNSLSVNSDDNTSFSLSIIESLDFSDEDNRREGLILRDILRLSGHDVHYIYIRTRRELKFAIERFYKSRRRYLHISCHGNAREIALTLDPIPFKTFGEDVVPFLRGRRLFISACEVVNSDLARVVIPGSGCYSLVGPKDAIRFDDAVIMWASFYHLMFRDGVGKMRRDDICKALRRIHRAFGIKFDYFRPEQTGKGYSRVNVDES